MQRCSKRTNYRRTHQGVLYVFYVELWYERICRKWEETEADLDDAILLSPSGGSEPEADPLGLGAIMECVSAL